MEFVLRILCKYTVQEIYKIILGFKQELGEFIFTSDSEFSITNINFRAWIEEDLEGLERNIRIMNNIFIQNLNTVAIDGEILDDRLIKLYIQVHNTDDIFQDNLIKFVGEFMRNIEGDCFVFENDNVLILRYKDKTYVDTYRYEDDEFGYHFEKLRIDYIKKRLTD